MEEQVGTLDHCEDAPPELHSRLPHPQSPSPFDQIMAQSNNRPIRRRFAVDGRVRSGCTTCKARKKKCDQQPSNLDPRCRSCARLGLVCEWPPLRRVSAAIRAPQKRKPSQSCASLSALSPPQEAADPAQRPSQSSQALALTDAAEYWVTEPPSPPGLRKGLGCLGWSAATIRGASERVLLKYYLEELVPISSILQESTAFCTVLLPMAVVDPSLLYSLYYYASTHLGSAHAATSNALISAESQLEFEIQAVQGLSKAIDQNRVSETTFACALVCSAVAVIGGDTSRWALHLQGAGQLLHHLGTQQLLRTSDGAFLLRNFAYHDIMAALSTCRRPQLEGVYWISSDHGDVDAIDCFMGLTHHIFGHISNMCTFIAEYTGINHLPYSSEFIFVALSQGDIIADALRTQHLGLDSTLDTHPNREAFVHHAEAFRLAALLHLYRFLHSISGGQANFKERMQSCGQQIMEHVPMVPLNLSCEIGLLFPLFMAGIANEDDEAMYTDIDSRLEFIEKWTKFKHVTRVRELLQFLWVTGRRDWEARVRELGWHISLA